MLKGSAFTSDFKSLNRMKLEVRKLTIEVEPNDSPCTLTTISGSFSSAVMTISPWLLSKDLRYPVRALLCGLYLSSLARRVWDRQRMFWYGDSSRQEICSVSASRTPGFLQDKWSNSCRAERTSGKNSLCAQCSSNRKAEELISGAHLLLENVSMCW